MRAVRPLSSIAVALAALSAAPSQAQISFEVLVDTSTRIPGQNQTFAGFSGVAVEGVVAFRGTGFPSGEGIYVLDANGLTTVVDDSTRIPGLPGGLTTLFPYEPSLDQGDVAFSGAHSEMSFLLSDIGGLTIEAQPGDAIPDVPGAVLLDFFTCSLKSGSLGFAAWAAGGALPPSLGIYATGGGLHTVANVLTSVPGGSGTFTWFGFNPTYGSGGVAFTGGNASGFGVYRGDAVLQVVADSSTAIPGGSGAFTGFADGPTIRGGEVAFRAEGSGGQRGVYHRANVLSLVADTSTAIPGGSGTFTGFSEGSYHGPALNGAGSVAFQGQGAGGQDGIYAKWGGTLIEVVAVGDAIGNKTVSALQLGREGFHRRTLAFFAAFTDGSGAVVAATLPLTRGSGALPVRGAAAPAGPHHTDPRRR